MVEQKNDRLPNITELRVICQSVKFQHFIEGFYRKFSIYFTWLLLHTSISANQATLIQMALGLSGSVFISLPSRYAVYIGLFLWYFGYLFDFIDGEIARYRKKSTVLGLFIDGYNHLVNQAFIFISVGVYATRLSGGDLVYILAAIPAAIFTTLPVTAAMKGAVITTIGKGQDAYKNADISSYIPPKIDDTTKNSRKSFELFLIEKVQFVIHFPWNMIAFTLLIVAQLIVGNRILPLFLLLLVFYSVAYTIANFYFLFLWIKNNETARLFIYLKDKYQSIKDV